MPQDGLKVTDRIYDELIEEYKKNPNEIKTKKALVQIVYHAFVYGYSSNEKYQDNI